MKKNFLLITGGTGGHVIPANNFANYLSSKNITCNVITDRRGYKYLNNNNIKVYVVSSSNLNGNLISKLLGFFKILFGVIQSFVIVLSLKPSHTISFGSYASFSPMLTCIVLKSLYKINLYIHEQNSIVGRTNKLFLYFANKLFLNFDIKSKINIKFKDKIYIVGSPENHSTAFINKKNKNIQNNFTIFVSGGSQGSEFITNFATNLIKIIDEENIIKAKFFFQCPKHMINKTKEELKNINLNITLKEFFKNLDEILIDTNLAISRAGAGTIVDLINYKLPSILIPLPNAKDNHQLYNASILAKSNLGLVIDQKSGNLVDAKKYIYEIYSNPEKINLINKEFDMIKIKNSNSLIYKLIVDEE